MQVIISILRWIIQKISDTRKDNSLTIEHLSKTVYKMEMPIQEALRTVEENVKRLISPLGEFHWRGLNHPDKQHLSLGNFHANEQGDATLHTGVLLTSLSWKYFETEDKSVIVLLDKLLSYFELHQANNDGGFGRNFVQDEFYQQFPASEKDGTFNAKSHMRYRRINHNDKVYWQRYDISIDAITHAICGLFWVYSYVPIFSSRAKDILIKLSNFLYKNNWKIKDDKGELVRYGDHSPKVVFFSRLNELILERVMGGKGIMTHFDKKLFNHVPSYVKDSDIHYFNSFIDLSQLLVLNHLGYNCIDRIKILKYELDGVENLFLNAVHNVITGSKLPTARDKEVWVLNSGHPFGKIKHNANVPYHLRTGYCKWEFPPFVSCLGKQGKEITGNADLLLAYWIR